MSIASNLGFPRIGPRRELKAALEAHWSGATGEAALLAEAARLRRWSRSVQRGAGLGHVPSGDAPLYDHVLDAACAVGAVPEGSGWRGEGEVPLATRFALARGSRGTGAEGAAGIAPGLPALEMTKWFDTNYHYLVPRLRAGQRFAPAGEPLAGAFREALAEGCRTRPVLLGPVTLLLLSKTEDGSDPLALLPSLLDAYGTILRGLGEAGARWVQVDEPCLATGLPPGGAEAYRLAFRALADAAPGLDLLLASYFGPLGPNLALAASLPVAGLHLDLARGRDELPAALEAAADRPGLWLSLGVVDGRNVWRTDLRAALATLRAAEAARPGGSRRLMVAPSCSLLHVPVDLDAEGDRGGPLDPEVRPWLAFAVQKVAEVAALSRGLDEGDTAIGAALAASDKAAADRRASRRAHDPAVAARTAGITDAMLRRASPFPARREAQRARLPLPPFPTTTIGSFPQTEAVRRARADLARGRSTEAEYEAFLDAETEAAVRWQEAAGLDVLVHGEFERNDMVKYFGERLAGFALTRQGWVQSYGSRCVAPPIVWGDVSRPAPMTVARWRHAQSLTGRPVKGMLTGPVTMLGWSFVRDDLPRDAVCRQVALAVRDEVADLEAAGCAVVQVDEPAFREGLPLRAADRPAYLRWAVDAFRLATSPVRDETQVHTHMCYSEFGDIMGAVAAMDADAVSIETARSRMDLLDAFARPGASYPNEIGPGVWDIHSPRVPTADEMASLLRLARGRGLADWQVWVNPDCGLKTRRWEEVRPAIANMVEAARTVRAEAGAPGA